MSEAGWSDRQAQVWLFARGLAMPDSVADWAREAHNGVVDWSRSVQTATLSGSKSSRRVVLN